MINFMVVAYPCIAIITEKDIAIRVKVPQVVVALSIEVDLKCCCCPNCSNYYAVIQHAAIITTVREFD